MFENFTKEELEEVVQRNTKWSEICKQLGVYDKHNKMVPYLKKRLDFLDIDYSKLDNPMGKPINLKNRHNKYTKFSDEEIFRYNSPVDHATIRRRYLSGKFSEYICAICGCEPFWNGKPLVLTMDHIDGDTNNNCLNNLRWICPNCDRQLPTYAGRNKKRENQTRYARNTCKICGANIGRKNQYCLVCMKEIRKRNIKANTSNPKPNRSVLKNLIRNNSFVDIGKMYGVSYTSVKKWCRTYDLPSKKYDINKYSDDEWKNI